MAKSKKDCHHCGKRLKEGHHATMVKDGKKYLLHKNCAKQLETEELAAQKQEPSNVVPLKMPGGKDTFGPSKMSPINGMTEKSYKHMQEIEKSLSPATVLQTDARVLREGLAKVFKMVPPPIQQEINNILGRYARQVSAYCQHPEKAYVPMRGCSVCIDCGAGDIV